MIAVDWTISFGSMVILAIAIMGFVGQGFLQAYMTGRFTATVTTRQDNIEGDMKEIKESLKDVSKAMVTLSEQKIELQTLNRRIDDVQQHGSYKLGEILDGMRRQTLSDMKDLIAAINANRPTP